VGFRTLLGPAFGAALAIELIVCAVG
jgi:hypothetical protein